MALTRRLALLLSAACITATQALATTPPASSERAKLEYDMLLPANRSAAMDALLRYRGNPAAIAKDGSVGRNKARFSDVAAQRDALWALRYAIRAQQAEAARRALDAVDYAFRHQSDDGHFENGLGLDAVRAIEADAFFLAAYGQFYYLAGQTPLRDEISPRLLAHQKKLRAAVEWLVKNREALFQQGSETPNRLLFDALALLLNGQIVGDAPAVEAGKDFFRRSLAMQHTSGYFLEKGGHDSSYQAVCLLNLAAIYSYVQDPEIAAQAFASARTGLTWLGARIADDGAVSVEGNTRTGRGQEKFFGSEKDVNYPEVIYALFQWSGLDNGDYRQQADAVTRYLRSRLETK